MTSRKWCPDNFPQGKMPPVGVRVWFRVKVRIRVVGQFPSPAIVLKPKKIYVHI